MVLDVSPVLEELDAADRFGAGFAVLACVDVAVVSVV